MFQSAVNKLTAWYVGALVMVCLLFSIPLYNITANSLEHGAMRQSEIIREFPQQLPDELFPQLRVLREKQLNEDRRQLATNLFITNLLIIGVGSVLSYIFAKRTMRPIEEAHEAQSRFTSDASHELRTPLATMQTEIEVALRDKKLDTTDAKAVLSSNLEEIARLRTLSDRLLELTRLDNNDLSTKTVNLGDLVNKEIKQLNKRYGIKISAQLAPNVKVKGDEYLLSQALIILGENAVRYSGPDQPKIKVELFKKSAQAILIINDQGIGISPDDMPHIFDRFYRGKSATKQSHNGHGLGLSLAKSIVEHHGGYINAASDKKGTTFTIKLPLS